jgi:hypothetical protein
VSEVVSACDHTTLVHAGAPVSTRKRA